MTWRAVNDDRWLEGVELSLPFIFNLAPTKGLATSKSRVDAKLRETQGQLPPLSLEPQTHCANAHGQKQKVQINMASRTKRDGDAGDGPIVHGGGLPNQDEWRLPALACAYPFMPEAEIMRVHALFTFQRVSFSSLAA
jgi:hypothetical protein